MFLLDTNVVSETRKPRPSRNLSSWIEDADAATLFMSVMSVGEFRKGIEQLRLSDAKGAAEIDKWLGQIEIAFGNRLLPVTREIADAWGAIAATSKVDHIDVLLAATARVHGLTLVTRNTKHVDGLGVPVVNLFEAP